MASGVKPVDGMVKLDKAVVVAAEESLRVRDALMQPLKDATKKRLRSKALMMRRKLKMWRR